MTTNPSHRTRQVWDAGKEALAMLYLAVLNYGNLCNCIYAALADMCNSNLAIGIHLTTPNYIQID